MSAISVSGLRMRYPDGPEVLSGIDLTVETGEVVALVGANGAGKSTLMRCIARLQEPTAGTVRVGDVDLTAAGHRDLRTARRDIGFVFQKFHLVSRLSAFQNVVLGAIGRHGTKVMVPLTCPSSVRSRAVAALERVGMGDFAGRRVSELSGGQQQRVAIARMLMQEPTVVLADEPVASLDPVAGVAVMELLAGIAREHGFTVLMSLHQMDLALRYAERVVGIRHGRIVLDRSTLGATPSDLAIVYVDTGRVSTAEQPAGSTDSVFHLPAVQRADR